MGELLIWMADSAYQVCPLTVFQAWFVSMADSRASKVYIGDYCPAFAHLMPANILLTKENSMSMPSSGDEILLK